MGTVPSVSELRQGGTVTIVPKQEWSWKRRNQKSGSCSMDQGLTILIPNSELRTENFQLCEAPKTVNCHVKFVILYRRKNIVRHSMN